MANNKFISRRRMQFEIAVCCVATAGVAFAAGWYLGLTTAFDYAERSLR